MIDFKLLRFGAGFLGILSQGGWYHLQENSAIYSEQ